MSAMTAEQVEALNGLRSSIEDLHRAAQPLLAVETVMVHFDDEEVRAERLDAWYKRTGKDMTACRAAMTAVSKAKKALKEALAPPQTSNGK